MRYDLKTPCKNCPFRSDATAIRFSCAERAEEIEDQAYRNGFPCHLSAEYREDDYGEEDGYHATDESQHCIGYIIMMMNEGQESAWPGIGNDEKLIERLYAQVDLRAPVFGSTDEFVAASEGE